NLSRTLSRSGASSVSRKALAAATALAVGLSSVLASPAFVGSATAAAGTTMAREAYSARPTGKVVPRAGRSPSPCLRTELVGADGQHRGPLMVFPRVMGCRGLARPSDEGEAPGTSYRRTGQAVCPIGHEHIPGRLACRVLVSTSPARTSAL